MIKAIGDAAWGRADVAWAAETEWMRGEVVR